MDEPKVYCYPIIGKIISCACMSGRMAIHMFALWFLCEKVGTMWALAIIFACYALDEANKETVYSHSNFGIGPGVLETFLENIARAIRDTLVLFGILGLVRVTVRVILS